MKSLHFIIVARFVCAFVTVVATAANGIKESCEVKQKINSTVYEAYNCTIGIYEYPSIWFDFHHIWIIEQITFNQSRVNRMPKELFEKLKIVQQVNMTHVGMTTLGSGAFKGARVLKRIDLYGNGIQELPDEVFGGANSLESLNLTKNAIKEVGCNAFSGVLEFKEILLGENLIEDLCESLFHDLLELESFNVSHNQIKHLPKGLFFTNSKLKVVDLSHNQIMVFDVSFTVKHLCYLNLNGNKLSSLSPKFDGVEGMECESPLKLLADENSISSIDFPDNYHPEILSLNYNSLHDLVNITCEPTLKHLFLSGNPLNEEDIIQITNLTNLQNLSLSHINIDHFDFRMLKKLTYRLLEFDISDNGLHELDLSVVKMHEIIRLNISNNQLMHIDEDYLRSHFPNLKFFDINNNRWGCQYLQTMLHVSYKRQRINALPQKGQIQVKNKPNVDGIACLQEVTTGHLEIFRQAIENLAKSIADDTLGELKADINGALGNSMSNDDNENCLQGVEKRMKNFEQRFTSLEGRLENLTQLNEQVMHRIIKLLDGE